MVRKLGVCDKGRTIMKNRQWKKLVCKTTDCIDNIGMNNKDFKYGCGGWGDCAPKECEDYTKTNKQFKKLKSPGVKQIA